MELTSIPVPLRDFVDVDQPAYGRIVFYTVNDVAFSHDAVVAELAAHHLSKYAPKRPADVDVFRRTSTAAAVNRVEFGANYANVLVRDVTNDGNDDSVLRRLVVEVVDADNEQLDYLETYDLRFYKDGGRLTHLPLCDIDTPADDVVTEIRRNYLAKKGTINGDAVRMVIKKAIRDNDGIGIRPSGGVFFVPESHAHVVDALHRWAALHREHIQLMSFPLVKQVDGQGEDLLAGAFTSEAVDECEKLLGELIGGDVSERRLTSITVEHAALSKRLRTYQAILSDTLDSVATKVDALDTAIVHAHTGLAAAA